MIAAFAGEDRFRRTNERKDPGVSGKTKGISEYLRLSLFSLCDAHTHTLTHGWTNPYTREDGRPQAISTLHSLVHPVWDWESFLLMTVRDAFNATTGGDPKVNTRKTFSRTKVAAYFVRKHIFQAT